MFIFYRKFATCVLLCSLIPLKDSVAQSDSAQESIARVRPWTSSNVKGSPEPPLPFKATRIFQNVELTNPTDIVWAADAKRWIATQLSGKILSFPNDPDDARASEFLDLTAITGKRIHQAYAVLFHPDQVNHPWCFVTYSEKANDPNGIRLARFHVIDSKAPRVDPQSIEVLLRWSSGGHSGGSMAFGADGMLYVSTGDAQPPYPPDADGTGQDLSDLESSILRIDVNHSGNERKYRIPPDNPFISDPKARDEIWSFGYRNPWKIAFDPEGKDLLIADVGWEMREMIYRVERGRNHGWSLMEGTQPVKQDETANIPITPPLFEHTHLDARSISGGHFWNSDRFPELKGAYLYGDWMTGKVWALKTEGDELLWQKELVDTPLRIIGFMLGPTGEVHIIGYGGGIYRLERNEEVGRDAPFPKRLSQTGLFQDVVKQLPAKGVEEYKINAHHWADGTLSRQWIAVPNSQQLSLYKTDDWKTGQTVGRFIFPPDTVLAKTVSYHSTTDDPNSKRRLETQILHRYQDDWKAYNYVWNDDQTDAILQNDVATEKRLVIKDPKAPGGKRVQTWRHASRSECLLCHIWAAGTAHAFWPPQLDVEAFGENQLARFSRIGLFSTEIETDQTLVSPHNPDQPLEARARAYLALNCSTCHRPQGGGTANFNFNWTKSLRENNYVDAVPAQGTFEIADAKVVAKGEPTRSVLLYRMLKSGRGHMPQFGSNVLDRDGVRLLQEWISSMPDANNGHEPIQVERLGSDRVDAVIDRELESTSGAMRLSLACLDAATAETVREAIIQRGTRDPRPHIRGLFESFLPEEKRTKRLGIDIEPAEILSISGSAKRGKTLFESSAEVNCRACHKIGDIGKIVGPNLLEMDDKQSAEDILTSLLRPSEKIDPKYRTRQILTVDGKTLSGLVIKETSTEVEVADSTGKVTVVPVDEIEVMKLSTQSIMPERLLSGMTAQQAADLLAYLVSLKETERE